MRLCAAQLESIPGNVEANIRKHRALIGLASSRGARLICFPELSLTGYAPKLAKNLAMELTDPRLSVFQEAADSTSLRIALGLPTSSEHGIRISMIVFQPGEPWMAYHKQQLPSDELAYFVQGDRQVVLECDSDLLAPAICYESLQRSHAEHAYGLGADVYFASVAKSVHGVQAASAHYPAIAQRYSMTVIMANAVGCCEDFVAVGQSAAWNRRGELLAQLDGDHDGIALIDTESNEVDSAYLSETQA